MKLCVRCGQMMPDSGRFCPECGALQPEVKLPSAEERLRAITDQLADAEMHLAEAEEKLLAEEQRIRVLRAEAYALRQELGWPAAPPQAGPLPQAGPAPQPSFAPHPVPAPQPIPRPARGRGALPRPRIQAEFDIGAHVLAVIGVLFVVAAFLIFGSTILTGRLQGLFTYLIFAVLLAFSELFIRARMPRFAEIISALGILGLHAATVVNHFYQDLLGGAGAILVTALISGFTIWLSRKRESAILRVVLFLGCFIMPFFTDSMDQNDGYLVIAAAAFLINAAAAFLETGSHEAFINLFHMVSYTVLSLFMMLAATMGEMPFASGNVRTFTMALQPALACLLFEIMRIRRDRAAAPIPSKEAGAPATGGTGPAPLAGAPAGTPATEAAALQLALEAILMAVCVVCTAVMSDSLAERFPVLLLLSAAPVLGMIIDRGRNPVGLSRLLVLWLFGTAALANASLPHSVRFLPAAAAIGIAARFKEHKTLRLTAGCIYLIWAVCTCEYFRGEDEEALKALTCAALLALLGIGIRFAERFRDRYSSALLAGILIFTGYCHMTLWNGTGYLIYLGFLATGLAEIFLLCHSGEEAAAGVRPVTIPGRYLILAIYLTYMILRIEMEVPVMISLALFALAAAAVVGGFRLGKKSVRVYGLGLALFAAAKIAFYDFRSMRDLARVGVFLAAGVMALLISFLYIRLDQRGRK